MDTGGLTVGVSIRGGIGCMDGGTFLSEIDGAWRAVYGGNKDLVLGLGLGDIDDSIPLIFWGVGGGNAAGGCKKDPGWWKTNFLITWSQCGLMD